MSRIGLVLLCPPSLSFPQTCDLCNKQTKVGETVCEQTRPTTIEEMLRKSHTRRPIPEDPTAGCLISPETWFVAHEACLESVARVLPQETSKPDRFVKALRTKPSAEAITTTQFLESWGKISKNLPEGNELRNAFDFLFRLPAVIQYMVADWLQGDIITNVDVFNKIVDLNKPGTYLQYTIIILFDEAYNVLGCLVRFIDASTRKAVEMARLS
jgi:hypothetical protein